MTVSVPISPSTVRTLEFLAHQSPTAETILLQLKSELPDICHYGDGPNVHCYQATIKGVTSYFFVQKIDGAFSVVLESPEAFEHKRCSRRT